MRMTSLKSLLHRFNCPVLDSANSVVDYLTIVHGSDEKMCMDVGEIDIVAQRCREVLKGLDYSHYPTDTDTANTRFELLHGALCNYSEQSRIFEFAPTALPGEPQRYHRTSAALSVNNTIIIEFGICKIDDCSYLVGYIHSHSSATVPSVIEISFTHHLKSVPDSPPQRLP